MRAARLAPTAGTPTVGKYRWYRHVSHHKVLDYLMLGWHIAEVDIGIHRNEYQVFMVWLCDCPMKEPKYV